MKTFVYIIGSLLTLQASAQAAQIAQGPIQTLQVSQNGSAQVVFSSQYMSGSIPACAANRANTFAFDATTTAGQNFYKFFLTAQTAGLKVVVNGLNSCSVASDIESIAQVFLNSFDN